MPESSTAHMSADFAEFFEQALPNNGRRHILALGELHDDATQLEFLKNHLPALKEKYGVSSIGLERPAFFNVFLWAYADGTLEKQLGSQEKAQAYLRVIFGAGVKCKNNAIAMADFVIAAIDAGMDLSAFDSRFTLAIMQEGYSKAIKLYATAMQAKSLDIRQRPELLNDSNRDAEFVWMLCEVDWLLGLKPEYKSRLNAMERLIEVGHREIHLGRLTSDGLSAAFELAQIPDTGNGITISGSSHIDGLGAYDEDLSRRHPEQVHGTFSEHLFVMGRRAEDQRLDAVTAAIITTVSVRQEVDDRVREGFSSYQLLAIAGHEVAHLNVDNGSVGKVWQPSQKHRFVVPLNKKFSMPDEVKDAERPAIQAAHLDPLKNPVIKKEFDSLRALLRGDAERNIVYDGPMVEDSKRRGV